MSRVEKSRAIFLTALMVLSVVAIGAAFAGSAAAQQASDGEVVLLDGEGSQVDTFTGGTAIQDAIDEAESDYTVAVGDGTYEENVVVDGVSDLKLTAADGANPEIDGRLRIGDPSDPNGADGTTVSGLTFADATGDTSRAIGVTASSGVTIEANRIDGYTTGVSLDFAGGAPSDVTVRGNTFESNGAAIGSTGGVTGLEITGNTFDDNDEGVGLGADVGLAGESSDVDSLLESNTFQNVDTPTQYAVGDYTVGNGPVKFAPNGAILVTDGDSIQTAIRAASAGDTIRVHGGTYEEMITVGVDDVTLKGIDRPLLRAPEDFDGTGGTPNVLVEEGATGVTVEGFEVDTRGVGGNVPSGIVLDGDEGKAIGNTVKYSPEGANGQGFISGSGDELLVKDNTVEDTVIAYGGDGSAEILNNTFKGPKIDEALWTTSSGDLTIKENNFTAAESGDGSADVKFTEGDVTVNGEDAPEDAASAVFENNTGVETVLFEGDDLVGVGDEGTISDGLEIAESGFTVQIGSGTYAESVTVDTRNVALSGEGQDDVIVDGRIDIPVDGVTVENLTVRNGAPRSGEVEGIFIGNPSGFEDTDGEIVVQNVTVEDVHPHGIEGNAVEAIHVKHYGSGDPVEIGRAHV